ncbi:MAG: type II toxin-antitoxin system prevent-host-death family antitoxin [Acidobacteriota bacterium]
MSFVGAFEAKTYLPALLARVAKGERITITKHGVPVAMLVPVAAAPAQSPRELIGKLRELRKGNRLGGISIRALIEEGRRY